MKRSEIEVGGVYEMKTGTRRLVESMDLFPDFITVFWRDVFGLGECPLVSFADEAIRRVI